MTSKELYEKYLETLKERQELEEKISSYIKKWKNGETVLNTKLVEEAIDKGNERLKVLKQLEQKLHQEFISMEKSEQEKRFADISLRAKLDQAPSNINITGGVLSGNATSSHLIGEEKTIGQLHEEKTQMLASIKSKVQSGELTLAEASKLVRDLDISYEFYDRQTQDTEKSSDKHL